MRENFDHLSRYHLVSHDDGGYPLMPHGADYNRVAGGYRVERRQSAASPIRSTFGHESLDTVSILYSGFDSTSRANKCYGLKMIQQSNLSIPSSLETISDFTSSDILNDLAWVAMRALDATIAVIVFDDADVHQTGSAAAPGDPWMQSHPSIDLATLADPRISTSLGLQYYAAVPVRNGAGERIGTVAVLRQAVSPVTDADLATLQRLARLAEAVRTGFR